MNARRTHNDNALIEDVQAVALDCLIEIDLHRKYQAEILASLPPEIRANLIQERDITDSYLRGRLRGMLDILAEARPGPYAYDPERPAARTRPVVSLEVAQ